MGMAKGLAEAGASVAIAGRNAVKAETALCRAGSKPSLRLAHAPRCKD